MITDLVQVAGALSWTIPTDRPDTPTLYRVYIYYDQAQLQLKRFAELPVRAGYVTESGPQHQLLLTALPFPLPLGQVNARVQPVYREFEGPASNQASWVEV